MRYCPNCKKEVNTILTPGQVAVMLILFPFFPIFLIYCVAHERKCPHCKSLTYPLTSKENGSQYFDILTFKQYVNVKKIIKDKKFVGYSFKGLQSDRYVYNAFFCMDKERAIQIDLDKQGCCNYYFDFAPKGDNTFLYYAEGHLTKKQ